MPIKSLTLTREASDSGVKQTTTGERADGTAVNASYTAKYDGKDVQVTGNSQYDTIAIKQVNANTLTDERKKTGGPYKPTGRTVISSNRVFNRFGEDLGNGEAIYWARVVRRNRAASMDGG